MSTECKTCLGSYGIGYTCPGCGVVGESVDIFDRFQALCADRDRLRDALDAALNNRIGDERLIDVMRRRYGREARQWQANHDERKAERDQARAALDEANRDCVGLREENERVKGHNALAQELEVKRVRMLETLNDRLFAWRNWSDEVAPSFGSDRDRSDFGQRKTIADELTRLRAENERMRAVYEAALRWRAELIGERTSYDLRLEAAIDAAQEGK